MTPRRAAQLLGLALSPTLSVETVRQQFAARARDAHPDTGSNLRINLNEIKLARNVLMTYCEHQSTLEDCKMCSGTGQQPTRRAGLIKCSSCAGEGVVKKKETKRG